MTETQVWCTFWFAMFWLMGGLAGHIAVGVRHHITFLSAQPRYFLIPNIIAGPITILIALMVYRNDNKPQISSCALYLFYIYYRLQKEDPSFFHLFNKTDWTKYKSVSYTDEQLVKEYEI